MAELADFNENVRHGNLSLFNGLKILKIVNAPIFMMQRIKYHSI